MESEVAIRQDILVKTIYQWGPIMTLLQKQYSLSKEESEDVFQDSWIALQTQIEDGKVDVNKMSLTSYFKGICKNKAHELLRSKEKVAELVPISEQMGLTYGEFPDDRRIEEVLHVMEEESSIRTRKQKIVRTILRNLPERCRQILWGSECDGFSMLELANMYGYSSATSVRVTKLRCVEKFKSRFLEAVKSIY